MTARVVSFTVDLEPDCPPYLWSWRGVEEGMPLLLDMLAGERITATFFTTGEVARRYPGVVRRLVDAGHELACHGMSHQPFDRMSMAEARSEITESAAILRAFAPVTSFRAPYLRFPAEYLDLLVEAGMLVDSSTAKYKRTPRGRSPIPRSPASVTSSVLRAWDIVRWPYLRAQTDPVVLFV
ncbi:MAG TPA: polysaccharide deacetylase family protein, partial [Gemmatimonadaceae bacterium]|nr:polysaccharide deacetylase family protein [Gemmatimonadaceae bacterium]